MRKERTPSQVSFSEETLVIVHSWNLWNEISLTHKHTNTCTLTHTCMYIIKYILVIILNKLLFSKSWLRKVIDFTLPLLLSSLILFFLNRPRCLTHINYLLSKELPLTFLARQVYWQQTPFISLSKQSLYFSLFFVKDTSTKYKILSCLGFTV
jgi:hypothetical protein